VSSEDNFIYSSKNAFSSGELTPTMEGRTDLPIYQHGAAKLINFMILPSGGIKRRHGTEYIHHFDDNPPPVRCMLNMMYSRSISFLVIFTYLGENEEGEDETKIEVFINGEGAPIILDNIEVKLKSSKFSYTSYQGVSYISFGIEYPIYHFYVDPGEVERLDSVPLEEWSEGDRRNLFICKKFEVTGSVYGDENANKDQNQLYRELINQEQQDQINTALSGADSTEIDELKSSSISVFEGRLWALGTGRNIHEIFASGLGSMSSFNLAYKSLLEARNPLSAFSASFISSTFDKILWSVAFAKELLIGSTDGIYILKTGDRTKNEFVHINKDIDMSISKIKPVICGKTIFFVEGDNKQIHSLYYSREKGGYQISCITNYAEHLFTSGIRQIVAVNSPFNILFAVMNNGSFASFTYSQDLKIMGWAQHWLGGDGKILEAAVMQSKNSESLYFRVRRETKLKSKPIREYIERFDCQYLTGSIINQPHTPLYADCHMHDLSAEEKEIDADFKKIIEMGSSFDFKGDISQIEELIEKQVELEGTFDLSNIGNHFYLGEDKINTLTNPDGDDTDLRRIWAEFIENYYNNYRKVILLSFGLNIAILRRLSEFGALTIKNLLSNESDIAGIDNLIDEIEDIYLALREQQEEINNWRVSDQILTSIKKITHVSEDRYAFFPGIMDSVKKDSYVNGFNNLISRLKLGKKITESFIYHPQEYSKKAKKQLLKEFIYRANSSWLTVNLNESIEELNFNDLAIKLSSSIEPNSAAMEQFQEAAKIFTIRNNILDLIEENIYKEFYIKFRPDGLAADYSEDRVREFFGLQIIYIIAVIYNSYDLKNIKEEQTNLIKETITGALDAFLNICLVIREDVRYAISIEDLVTEIFDAYLADDDGILRAVDEQRIKWRAKSIELGFDSDEDNEAKILSYPAELQTDLRRFNDISQYLVATSLIGVDQIREADDSDIEFDANDEFGPGGDYEYLSDRVKDAIDEKIKEYNNDFYDESAFNWLDEAVADSSITFSLDDFIYLGLEEYIDELHDPNIDRALLNHFKRFKEDLVVKRPFLANMNEFFTISYAQSIVAYKDIETIYIMLIRYANLTVPSENVEFFTTWQDQVNPSKIDKFLFLAKEYFPIFRQNFPDIDTNMLKVITRGMSASKRSIVNREMYPVYFGMSSSFIGDDELIKSKIIGNSPSSTLIEHFEDYYRFISVGFNYKSVLKTFPFVFPEEFERIIKKDTGLQLKLFNTKGGYIEEKTSLGGTRKQFIHTPKVDFDIINHYLPDKKYLMAEAINSIRTPYLSGWVHFTCNRPIEKDIDLVYVVDKPYPATILKIDAKAKLYPHHLK
jgi:hypothetical protein